VTATVEENVWTLPHDDDAERAIAGAVMMSGQALDDAQAIGLEAADFYVPGCAAVWSTVVSLVERSLPHDPVTVWRELVADPAAARSVGGPGELASLAQYALPASAGHHARIIREMSARRRAVAGFQRAIKAALTEGTTIEQLRSAGQAAVDTIPESPGESSWSPLDEVIQMAVDEIETASQRGGEIDGVRWGWPDVDAVVAPIAAGDLAVVMGYPGGGKSVFVDSVALHAAVKQKLRVLVHSIEMSRREIGQKWVAAECRIPLDSVLRGDLSQQDWDRVARAMDRFADAYLIVDETETLSLATLGASIRRHQPDLVIVDQTPIMIPPDTRMTREQQIAALSYGQKRLARAERVAMLVAHQLNDDAQKRGGDRVPQMRDARESKAVGQAANTVLIVHDPTEGDTEHKRVGEIDLWVRKQRRGRKDFSIPMASQLHMASFGSLKR